LIFSDPKFKVLKLKQSHTPFSRFYRVQHVSINPFSGLFFIYRTSVRLHLLARSHLLRRDCACVLVSLKSSAI